MRYGRLAGHTLAPSRRPRPTRYSCSVWRVLENTGALEQRHVDATASGSAEGGSAAWPEVDGLAEPEDGAAEAAASELDGSGEVEGGAAEGAETLPCFSM